MRILVTGADGFTGRHFVSTAVARGHEVVALRANLNDSTAVKTEIAALAPEAVVHLAAISFVGHADASAFYSVNVIGTLNLLDALAALPEPPRSVLLASSANIYGNCEQSPITESQPPAPVNHYAMSKLAMEHMARTYLDRLPLFFVRPFNYTGAGQAASFVIPKLVAHFSKRAESVELGNLDVEREFNDVRFVCETYLQLLEKAKPGMAINICSGLPITLKSVITLLSDITGHQLQVNVNPAFVRNNEIHRLCGSAEKLIDVIGPVSHRPLRETLQWMLEQSESA
ncbi:GDP-mannose 4,6-dehydratase [Undibacterium parvum]|uniref:NAD-dependent epimerase/dehydratase family protein n=2 Tax=Undibacterium TaxID=401469 RepID=A0A6M4A482_9BURK|nr:GDP-mannose 4,6-dehydratase [Undibacterium parvum]AZP11733.1 NAD-dependent epimerase/dehydratase family protein [Undibacterium parvum]QJQ06172.1 NAD-dependent epimerase/dehydratase family protein [Undibacterium piscinae]